MARTMSVSEARAALPQLLESVTNGDEVTITRHGRAVAVVVRPDTLRVRRADAALSQAAEVHDLIQNSKKKRLISRTALSEARAEELIANVRAGRSRR
jgi:antitoxin (DNA-binding transcriptional repressor) of toxin-antitoxin stability system